MVVPSGALHPPFPQTAFEGQNGMVVEVVEVEGTITGGLLQQTKLGSDGWFFRQSYPEMTEYDPTHWVFSMQAFVEVSGQVPTHTVERQSNPACEQGASLYPATPLQHVYLQVAFSHVPGHSSAVQLVTGVQTSGEVQL
jgi:hypothetical protein